MNSQCIKGKGKFL